MRFMCSLKMALTYITTIEPGFVYMICLHDVTRKRVAAQTDYVAEAFFIHKKSYMWLWPCDDVMTFEILQPDVI